MAVDASPGAGRVLIATGAGPLAPEPTWSRFDNLTECTCFGFDWQRGRQSELDVTETGNARVFFHDTNDTFLSDDFIGLQIMLQLHDPVLNIWEPVFRGRIKDAHGEPSPSAPDLTNVQLDLVGPFEYVAGVKMVVGTFGINPLPGAMSGVVYYAENPVDQRIEELGTDADIHGDMLVVFSGNVDVHDTLYDTDDDILSAMRDAADAEFPGIGNIYEDRYGRIVFHGRFAKFDPDGTASGAEWNFQRWNAATRGDVTSGRAQIREFQYNRPLDRIINTYVAWPELTVAGAPFDQNNIGTLTKTDATSVTAYGWKGREAPSLIIKEHKTNGNTGAQECELFGEYYVTNYAVPRKNVERVSFKSLPPTDTRAGAVWEVMTKIDISDAMVLWIAEAGLSEVEFFVEGISGSCRVGPSTYDFVTVTPNLSPAAYYTDNVFE